MSQDCVSFSPTYWPQCTSSIVWCYHREFFSLPPESYNVGIRSKMGREKPNSVSEHGKLSMHFKIKVEFLALNFFSKLRNHILINYYSYRSFPTIIWNECGCRCDKDVQGYGYSHSHIVIGSATEKMVLYFRYDKN